MKYLLGAVVTASEMTYTPWWVLAGALVVLLAAALVNARYRLRITERMLAAAEAGEREAMDAWHDTINQFEAASKKAAETNREIEKFIDKERRRADEYLGKIEGVIEEREVWRKLYMEQASGHDNAQALMMEEISRLSQTYQAETNKTLRLNPLVETVRAAWGESHGPAAVKATDERVQAGREKT